MRQARSRLDQAREHLDLAIQQARRLGYPPGGCVADGLRAAESEHALAKAALSAALGF